MAQMNRRKRKRTDAPPPPKAKRRLSSPYMLLKRVEREFPKIVPKSPNPVTRRKCKQKKVSERITRKAKVADLAIKNRCKVNSKNQQKPNQRLNDAAPQLAKPAQEIPVDASSPFNADVQLSALQNGFSEFRNYFAPGETESDGQVSETVFEDALDLLPEEEEDSESFGSLVSDQAVEQVNYREGSYFRSLQLQTENCDCGVEFAVTTSLQYEESNRKQNFRDLSTSDDQNVESFFNVTKKESEASVLDVQDNQLSSDSSDNNQLAVGDAIVEENQEKRTRFPWDSFLKYFKRFR